MVEIHSIRFIRITNLDQRLNLVVGEFLLLPGFQKFSERRQGNNLRFRSVDAGTIIDNAGCSHRVEDLFLLEIAAAFVLVTVYRVVSRQQSCSSKVQRYGVFGCL